MTIVIALAICRPLKKNWDKQAEGSCGDLTSAFVAVAVIDVVADLAIMLLPVPVVWQLQVPRSSKIALTGIFGLGIL